MPLGFLDIMMKDSGNPYTSIHKIEYFRKGIPPILDSVRKKYEGD